MKYFWLNHFKTNPSEIKFSVISKTESYPLPDCY